MCPDDRYEHVLESIPNFDRERCKLELRHFDAVRLDFTDEFLERQSLDSLRHLLMAACLQARKAG